MDVGHRGRQEHLPRLGPQHLVGDTTDGTIAFLEGAGQRERTTQGFSVHRGAIDEPDLTGDEPLGGGVRVRLRQDVERAVRVPHAGQDAGRGDV